MSIIQPNRALVIDYNTPDSHHINVRVASLSQPVNVYLMEEDRKVLFLQDKTKMPIVLESSILKTMHEFNTKIRQNLHIFYLIIDNPWSVEVEVQYVVNKLEKVRYI